MTQIIGNADEQEFLDMRRGSKEVHEGMIKIKLIHAKGFSLVMPELFFADIGGWKWFQPKFFTASRLSFIDDLSICRLSVDLSEHSRVVTEFCAGQLVRKFEDGSHLYRCFISGEADLGALATGTCSFSDNSEILLDLFHHTTPASRDAIVASGHFRASAWNVQGTKKLQNVAYAYFTSLSAITTESDLRRIAMASDGQIALMPTNGISRADAVIIRVYRENTHNRTATLKVSVPISAIASQHIYRHSPQGNPVYYEICHPEIFRVGLIPGNVLQFQNGRTEPVSDHLKKFDYLVLGNADTPNGLKAPYDEENTQELFLVERCPDESVFDFWKRNANTDQMSGRSFERMTFEANT